MNWKQRPVTCLGYFKQTILAVWLLVLLASCSGGGGSGNTADPGPGGASPPTSTPPPPAPVPAPVPASAPVFGLSNRTALVNLSLPVDLVSLGSYDLVPRFPNLTFSNPLFFAGVPGENRIVILQQSGEILEFENSTNAASANIILNLAVQVLFAGEQGLLGLAFDPAFVTNRYIYVHYSAANPRRSVISRFTWPAGNPVDPVSEKIIIEVPQPFSNHNGGSLAFGPDDLLYIGFGDGGSGGDPQNNAQNPGNRLGSMLRINVHPSDAADSFAIPADNPFLGQSGFLPETYAYGLRNPFRFSFDRQTGDLWLGDVGQSTLEEIDVILAGKNYGWRVFEGSQGFDDSLNTLPTSQFTFPVFEYGRAEGIAIIGGYVYRGNALPGLQGRYLYSDFGSGTVWALELNGTEVLSNNIIASTSSPTSFGEDNEGEIYIVSRDGEILGLEEATGGEELPDLLSETGVFSNLSNLTIAPGFIEYNINHSFWSDNTIKKRWLGIPGVEQIQFTATSNWTFPTGSVIVKHFEIALTQGDANSNRRLETRLLINTESGWQGFTYRWNEAQTDATLLTARLSETLNINLPDGGSIAQLYEYPSRTDCLQCHTNAAGTILGVRTRQINRDFPYPATTDNQLRSLNNIELFNTNIGEASQYSAYTALADTSSTIRDRARTYLEVNCAQCHQPLGPTPVDIDLRLDTADANMNAIGVIPTSGNLGIADAEIIAPGQKERSILWQRLRVLNDNRMPPLASHLVDESAVEVIGQWIDEL